jgi:hypothetical protein
MTVTYDATHHRSLQVSPMTRLICHLCRELTHPFAHHIDSEPKATNSKERVAFVLWRSRVDIAELRI